jgi:anti-sigma-K factor RskA
MTCQEFQALLLAGETNPAMAAHLPGCATCRAERASLEDQRDLLAQPWVWETPDAGLEHRIVADIAAASRPGRNRSFGRKRAWAVAAITAVISLVSGGWWLSTRPDWSLSVPATVRNPDAIAVVSGWNSGRGTQMLLDVKGLAPAGRDAYYEIWLTAPDGRHVSAGTFKGSGEIEAFVAVRRVDYPRIWITREPEDDDLSPSRYVVFDTGYLTE